MLSFDEIEDCCPDGEPLCGPDGRVTVSGQWLHDFAHAVAAKEREACGGRNGCDAERVAEKLDELADLCEYWKRNRDNGRTPSAIRSALLMMAEELRLMGANVEASGAEDLVRKEAAFRFASNDWLGGL